MKQYDTYKDSSIPSIGTIPNSWRVVPIKYVLEQSANGIKIGPFGSTLTGKVSPANQIKVYGQWNVIGKDFSAGKNYVSEDTYQELESYWIHPNDILISMMGTVGKCAIIPKGVAKGIMDSHIVKVRLDETIILPQFFYYVYDKDGSNVVISQIQRDRRGSIMDGLNSTLIKSFIIPLPPLSEQQDIVSFLDEKVNMIDATIAEKEQMLKDLKNYRSAIISEAVTKGLDKNVEMKDSGIEWLGMIPKTWKIVRIKHILDYKTDSLRVGPFGSSLSGNDFKTEGYWVYNQRVVLDNNFNSNDTFVSQEKYKELSSFKVFAGDILLTTRGTIGKVAIVPNTFHEGVLHPCLIRFRVDDSIVNKDFLAYYFNDTNLILDQVKYNSNSTTIDVIYSYTLKELIISLPPLDVQNDIVAHLNYKVQKIDEMLKEASQSVEDLKSYKSALITEAVTGKIDLRDWKPKEENV